MTPPPALAAANFRDAATYMPQLRPGRLFRSASLVPALHEVEVQAFFQAQRIGGVIDLRTLDEVADAPYPPQALAGLTYLHLPIDPRQQSAAFIRQHHHGTHIEIAYRHYAAGHAAVFAELLRQVAHAPGGLLIHCHYGKDRTGAAVALLAAAAGLPQEAITADYLASGQDTQATHLQAFMEIVAAAGGPAAYLAAAGASPTDLLQWQERILA